MKPSVQLYDDYTQEDFKVWKTLFSRQMDLLSNIASAQFFKAVETVAFTADKIPRFTEVNEILENITGWQLVTVPNISPVKDFFTFLSEKKFTATCWLRKLNQLDYIEEPDMFHDVFAHTPLLSNQEYCDFFQAIGKLAVKNIDNEKILISLQRLYWFTIEFGLMNENGHLKIYGAGIISSRNETGNVFSRQSKKHDFDLKKIISQPFRNDVIQKNYFVINSFDELKKCVYDMEKEIEIIIAGD